MRTVSGYINVEGLGDIAEAFDFLGKYAFSDALQTALTETAQDAVARMADPFAAAIEGGPVPFTRIKPGKRSSAVVARTQKGATKGVAEASVAVQPNQAEYLAWVLGADGDREPGEAGVATKHNFIAASGNKALRPFGLRVDKYGNLNKRAAHGNGVIGHLGDLAKAGRVGKVDQKRDARNRFLATETGDRTKGTVFWGRPKSKSGTERALGFYGRPKKRDGKIVPLVYAVPRSRYEGDYAVPAWNNGIEGAINGLEERVVKRLLQILEEKRGVVSAKYKARLARERDRRAKARAQRELKKLMAKIATDSDLARERRVL